MHLFEGIFIWAALSSLVTGWLLLVPWAITHRSGFETTAMRHLMAQAAVVVIFIGVGCGWPSVKGFFVESPIQAVAVWASVALSVAALHGPFKARD